MAGFNHAYQEAWYEKNRERELARMRAWGIANRERVLERRRAYREANRDRLRDAHAKRRAARFGAAVIEDLDRAAIVARDKSICHICLLPVKADEMQLDHVIPLSRGGLHTADNVAVAHDPCNRRKARRLLSEVTLEELGVV